MKQVSCPKCGHRLFDSDKPLYLAALSNGNKEKADIILKHHFCNTLIAVRLRKNTTPEITLTKWGVSRVVFQFNNWIPDLQWILNLLRLHREVDPNKYLVQNMPLKDESDK